MASRTDLKELLKHLERQGAEITKTKSGYWHIVNPRTGRSVNISSTPGHDSTVEAAKTRVRRIGLRTDYGRGTSRKPRPALAHGR